MVKTWKSESAGDVQCEECGAIYSKTIHRFPIRDNDSFSCEVCGHLMDKWNSTFCPSYELKESKRPS